MIGGKRIRFAGELAVFDDEGNELAWKPATIEMGVSEHGRAACVYDVEVTTITEKRVEEQAVEIANIRDRVGRIVRCLEGVTSELRQLAEGMTPEESARVLDRIETSLGIPKG